MSLTDHDVQMSILKSVVDDGISLILDSKKKTKQLPFFRGILFKEESEVTFQLVYTSMFDLKTIPEMEWNLYTKSSIMHNRAESIAADVLSKDTELAYSLIVFEQKRTVVFALLPFHKDLETFICTIPSGSLANRTVFLDSDWEENKDFEFLKEDYGLMFVYH